MMEFDINKHNIFKCIAGSHAYGMATKYSDEDIRGVAIPPIEYYIGYLHKFEQHDPKSEDICIWSLQKFMRLAANANPNIIELFFIPKNFWLKWTPYWNEIINNRILFMSKKIRYTFNGEGI